MKKYRYKLNISYDGFNYQGWQKQPNKKTIQEEIEKNLNKICGNENLSIEASGRTDAGVHAKCQVAHFDINNSLNTSSVKKSLNCLLKDDIRIISLVKVSSNFHSRFDTKSKEYRYFINNAKILSPHIRHFRHHESRPLNIQEMQKAANFFIGEHDFASFYVNPGYKINNTVREIFEFDVNKSNSSDIIIKVCGNGFLYKMVRSFAGFLIDVGLGRFDSNYSYELLNNLKRSKDVKTAPANGLFLWKVNY
mgnify:FL=1